MKFLTTLIFIEHLWWLLLEISSFLGMLYEKDVLKNIKLIDTRKKTSSGGALSKDVFKSFAKFTEKYLCGNLFFKLQTGNLKLSETVNGDVQENKMFLKILQISQESLFIKVAALRACNFIKKASDTGAFLGPLSCKQLF